MTNQFILIGRINKIIENGDNKICVMLNVPRHFKNMEGVYETDIISVYAYGMLSINLKEFCEKDDLIGIKGRVANLNGKNNLMIAEKISFLSPHKESDEE